MRRVIESDVCIIGSGISAAMVAQKLARLRPSARIVVVEAGDDVPPLAQRAQLRRRFLDYGENPWPGDHLTGYEIEGPIQSRSMCFRLTSSSANASPPKPPAPNPTSNCTTMQL